MGWVLSDSLAMHVTIRTRWAVHGGGAAAAGVDQELPGTPAGDNRVYFTAPVLARLSGGMASDTQLQPPFGGSKIADDTVGSGLEADSDSAGQEAWQWPWRLWPFNSRALGTATSAGGGGGAAGGGGAGGGGASRSLGTSAAPETAPETDRLSQMVARVLGGMLACGAFNTSVCAAGAAG